MGIHHRAVRIRLMNSGPAAAGRKWLWAVGLAFFAGQAEAQDIFRCEENGKIGYKSNAAGEPNCRPVMLYNSDPSAEEVERAFREKARRQAEEQEEAERAREQAKLDAQERAARALEAEASASRRRANVAEEQLRQEQERQRNSGYPAYGGYYLGTQHPRFGDRHAFPPPPPISTPPQIQPQPLFPPPPVSNSGRVGGDGARQKYQMGSETSPAR